MRLNYSWEWGLLLRLVNIIIAASLKKTDFSLSQKLLFVSSLLARCGALYPFPHLYAGLACVGHTHTVVVSASPCAHLLCLEHAFSLQLFTTSGSYTPLPLKQGTPNIDGRAYDKGTPSSLSLSICYSIQGLCVNYHLLQKNLLWGEMNGPWV